MLLNNITINIYVNSYMVVVVLYFSLTQIKEPALEPGLIVFTLVGKGQKHILEKKKKI